MQFLETIFRKTAGRILILLPLFLILLSCGKSGDSYAGYSYPAGKAANEALEMDVSFAEPAMLHKSAPAPENRNSSAEPEQMRKKSFRAGCSVRVPDPDTSILNLGKIAEKHDGNIDSVNGRTAVLKVPVKNLDSALDEIKKTGEVLSEYKEAEDVTEYYFDLDGRIKLLEKSRSRLTALLNYEKDVKEKVKILREIKRIDDELERLKSSLSSLEERIRYSEITVTYIPFNDYEPDRKIPFRWIENLDPYSCSVKEIYRRVKLPLPDDFAVLKKKRYFHAETSDGTRARIGSVRNQPEGDTEFWQKALVFYMERYYSRSEISDSGNVRGVVFSPKAGDSYRYFTGTYIRGPLLYIIEVFYPDEESFTKHKDGVDEALEKMRIR